jgi:prophage tail gpP-like protein
LAANAYKFVAHNLGLLTASENVELKLKVKSDTTKVVQIPTASTAWTVLHNMAKRPNVTTVDSSGNVIFGQVIYNSDHQITINFNPAVAGTVYLN